MLIVVVTMFVVLFAFLAGGLWIGWTLAAPARSCWRCSRHPARQAAGAVRLEHPDDAGAAGPAAVHPDGRDPVPHAPVADAVQRPGALGQACCRAPAARQRHRLHDLRRISGSSAATTQVVGRISLSELLKRGYSKDVAVGSLAGAGTLGFLIPPSNIMIIYGVLGDVSIAKLFTAGFIPGFLLAGCFMAWIMIHTALKPRSCRKRAQGAVATAANTAPRSASWAGGVPDPLRAGLDVWRPGTPSEAAGVGVLGALIVARLQGELTWRRCGDRIGAVQTCAMIALIVLGASILGSAAAFLGIPARWPSSSAASGSRPSC
jgi:hypothetical protein